MVAKRKQLNINISPELLLRIKREAIKSGKTLTTYVIEKLKNYQSNDTVDSIAMRKDLSHKNKV